MVYRQMPTPRQLSQQIPAPPGQKLGCKSPRVGANFWCKSLGMRGEWLWMKLIAALHFANNRSPNTKTQQRTAITTILRCQKCTVNVNDGLSISPLARYNCLSNLCPRGNFAQSISRGLPALPTILETADSPCSRIMVRTWSTMV